jgi:hypothetical protein
MSNTISVPQIKTVDTKINTVTSTELGAILSTVTKSTICNVTYTVDESKSKMVGGKKQVQKKVNIANLYLNQDYGKKVNNILEGKQHAQRTFIAQPMKGKERINTVLVASLKTGKILLDGKVLFTESRTLLAYYHDGKEIQASKGNPELNSHLFTPAFYKKSTYTSGRGAVSEENDFTMITLGLDNIDTIKFQGKWYKVKN